MYINNKLNNLKMYSDGVDTEVCLNQYKNIICSDDINNDNSNNPDPWLVNCTDIIIPETIKDVLRLSDNFCSSFLINKNKIVFETIKDLETNIYKIPEDQRDEFRKRVINTSSNFLKKSHHISVTDRVIAKNIKETNKFVSENKNLLITKADEGNITVILNRKDYIKKCENILNDESSYKKLDYNPEDILKKDTLKILDKCHLDGFLGKDIKKKDINVESTLLPKFYGLPKIHKVNNPV